MPKFESEIQLTSVKNASTSNGGIQFSDSSNTLVMHIGDDNRVGIGTEVPETTLHVDGAITATGLIVPPGVLSSATDTADFWGFNPIFDDWYTNESEQLVANGYIQTGTGLVTQSTDSVLGSYSALFPSGSDAVWSRKVIFPEPLYANVFIQGHYSYKFATHTSGEPGFAIRLKHRAVGDDGDSYSNTFISPTFAAHATGSWQTVNFRAVTPPNREIQELEISIVHKSTTDAAYDTTSAGVELSGGGGATQTALGGGTDYDWYVDGLGFNFMHPDMRIDQEGRITGSYIEFATITDAHIKNYIASSSSRIEDNPSGQTTALPEWHENYPTSGTDGTSKLSDALVANSSYAAGWSIDKEGDIKATGITIYSNTGKVLIKGGSQNPFSDWDDAGLIHLDPETHSYLYGLSFEESNSTDLRANLQFLATSGLSNNVIANTWSLYIANTVTGPPGDKGGLLANGTITFNGITVNAPPGSVFTGGKGLVKNQDAYIMFLANTEKWDSDVGNSQYYHANSYLGEYGLYVLGTPTVGGWLYHPHANDTWYTIDSEQSGNQLHENDFLVIGKIGTNDDAEIRKDKTFLQPPKHPDSITASESLGTQSPIGITAGGILFADIHLNQWEHTANAGEVQLTNQRNTPNTRFTFIHPGTDNPNDSKVYTVNGAYGVLTSLEDFPGSRYITFVGADPGRFTLQTGHSPDFVAAFPLGDKWYYNQDEGAFSTFTPSAKDCIVARVDANGSVGQITNIYRYAEREATTDEGASISDLIVDPPRGMSSGGFVFGEFKLNHEFDSSTNTFKANAGFVSLTNVENTPQNKLYVIHPENGNSFYVDSIGRGIVTSLKPTGDVYGTRHIAFVGQDQTRFDLPSAGYENVANDFVAVLRYDSDGNPRSDGKWYYDDGDSVTKTFTPDANDFVVATLSSYNPDIDGVDQLTRWSEREAEIFIDGVPTTITSMKVLLDARIDTANNTAQTAIDLANEAYANAVAAASNAYAALGLLDGKIAIYYEVEGAEGGVFKDGGEDDSRFDYNDLWINTSTYNKFLDDSWSTNAIFKYANTNLGFEGDLKWRHDANNAGGRAAISGLSAREFADRATVIFYEDRSAAAYPYYGPNVAVISAGSTTYLNKNPEGDLWYDTKPIAGESAPANHPYVYRTNATFVASNTTHSGFIATGEGSWAQTVHNTATSGTFDRNTAQTGWWSLQDSSAGDAAGAIAAEALARETADNLEINLRSWGVGNALSAAETAQAAADREILAFFVDSTATPPTSTGNGDVWIHTDNAIDSTGTMNAKSIFIANTNSPGSYGAGSVNPPQRFWNESPNNAIGLMFLEGYIATYVVNSIAYTAMASGNGKIVAHFGPHWPLDTGTHGPLPNTTPSGLENAEPHGDFWINTSNNNLAFVYHQNSLVNFAQTAYYNVLPENNYAGGSEPLSGWYSTEDMRTANALTTSHTALSDAASAQASADREIIAFFQNNVPTATGNGDIWIDTDKSSPLTAAAIYVAFSEGAATIGSASTGNWYQSPSSAVGQVYLNAYLAGETASRTESLIMNSLGTSDLPFPIWDKINDPDNVANGIMGVGATGNVVFYKNRLQSSSIAQAGEIFVENYGGVDFVGPTGKVWYPNSSDVDFGIPGGDTTITTPYEDSTGSLTIDTNISVGGNPWRHDGGAANVAYLMYSNQNVISRFGSTYTSKWGNNHHFAVVFWDTVLNTWSLRNDNTSGEPDPIRFIPDSANGDFLVAQIERKYTEEDNTGIHRLESWVFNTLPSQIKGLTDGKIVTHFESHYPTSGGDKGKYGPWPNTTPTGLSNPDPHGDFWIDTANNNLVFRYHQNTINRTARSVYHANNIQHKIDTDESGWYSTEDLRTSNALDTSYGALHLANSAVQDAARAQAAADREIVVFFATESNNPTTTTGNGDIWIVTDHTRKPYTPGAGFVANTRSIRVANTLLGSIDAGTLPGTIQRWWHESPNNAIGLSYLENYIQGYDAKTIADGKIVNHYGPEYGTGPYFGPDPEYHPKLTVDGARVSNPDAHGDRWVNTSNNNLEFVFRQNNASIVSDPAKAYAQTIFWHPGAGFDFDEGSDPSGWYSTEDDRVANALASSFNANSFAEAAQSRADDAYSAAGTAQAAADREILAFFSSVSSVPESTGNGDIWIQTDSPVNLDGTANTDAIYIANTLNGGSSIEDPGSESPPRFWNPAPYNAIGLSYIESYAAGASGEFQRGDNIMPRAISLFDAPITDYDINTSGTARANVRPYSITANNTEGHLSDFDVSIITSAPTGFANTYFGNKALKISHSHDDADGTIDDVYPEIIFANTVGANTETGNASPSLASFKEYGIDIVPGKKWILSLWAQNLPGASGAAAGWGRLGAYTLDIDNAITFEQDGNHWLSSAEVVGTGWSSLSLVVDLTEAPYNTHNKLIPAFRPKFPSRIISFTGSLEVLIDAIQLEEVASNVFTPSQFKEPSDASAIVFGRQITDGKILTRYEKQYGDYGPKPDVTPKDGLPNPEPHGDSWHNTSNNNLIFRYHQNSINNSAQTIFYPAYGASIAVEADSGWYSTEDPRTANSLTSAYQALSDAATAQAAADREIQAFFAIHSSTQSASGNGDVWIQTDNVLKPDGTANVDAIFVWNAAVPEWQQRPESAIGKTFLKTITEVVGTNWMPSGYSIWNARVPDDYALTDGPPSIVTEKPYPVSGANNEITLSIDNTQSYVGTSSLKADLPAGNPGGAWNQILFSNTTSTTSTTEPSVGTFENYGIKIPAGKKWIYSAWIRTDGSGSATQNKNFAMLFPYYTSNGSHVTVGAGGAGTYPAAPSGDGSYFYPVDSFNPGAVAGDWSRCYRVIDLTGTTANSIILGIQLYRATSPARQQIAWLDGIQLEQVVGDRVTPSPFQEPSDGTQLDYSRAIADGKIVTHYENNSGNPNWWGPNPHLTPKEGLPNITPHGDLWVDTANNNLVFRYHQNTTNYTSNSVYHANNVQHRIDTDESGWYSTEDLRTANLEATTNILQANVTSAILLARNAASAADAELLVFFEPSTNALMIVDDDGSSTGPATGNGDIWIHIDQVYDADGNQNTGSIFYANLHPGVGWTQSPDNAIGRGFLEDFTTVGVKNWMPSGYSMWDAPIDDYTISVHGGPAGTPNTTPYPISERSAQSAGLVNTSFGYVGTTSLQYTLTSGTDTEEYLTLSDGLPILSGNTFNDAVWVDNGGRGVITIPKGKRWIFSYYAYSNSAVLPGENSFAAIVFPRNLQNPNANAAYISGAPAVFTETNKWQRFSGVLDLTSHLAIGDAARPDFNTTGIGTHPGVDRYAHPEVQGYYNSPSYTGGTGAWETLYADEVDSLIISLGKNIRSNDDGSLAGNTVLYDGLQLEEAPGAQVLPGPFSDPDRRISSHFDRALADGKILTHYEDGALDSGVYYGPRPQVSPSGQINPAPHGDFWVDTANNNALYRYNQNNSYTITGLGNDSVAQTAFWSSIAFENNKSGWYSIQDGRMEIVGERIEEVYEGFVPRIGELEATTDGELQIFFESHGATHFANAVNTHPSASYGDIWINTHADNQFANGTLRSNAIFRWQNSLSGFAEYILDLEPVTNAPKGLAWRHAPNNSIGQVYLRAYAAQNVADQKITSYFQGGTTSTAEGPPYTSTYKGPKTNTTPTGIHNANPDGDVWIDTSNNNQMYVYHYNGGVHSVGFDRTIYYASSPTSEGWYSAADLRTAAHERAFELAAATGTDRHAQIFFGTSAPTTSTGNGDIWIKTDDAIAPDGTANLKAIYIANSNPDITGFDAGSTNPPSRDWHSEPTSGLGRSHLEKLASEIGSNWMSKAFSTFDENPNDYNHWINYQNKPAATSTGAYPDWNNEHPAAPYQFYGWQHNTHTTNTTYGYGDSGSLVITTNNVLGGTFGSESLTDWYETHTYIGNTTFDHPGYFVDPYNYVKVPKGKKWIYSFYIRTDFATPTTVNGGRFYSQDFIVRNSENKKANAVYMHSFEMAPVGKGIAPANWIPVTDDAASDWERVSGVLDLSSTSDVVGTQIDKRSGHIAAGVFEDDGATAAKIKSNEVDEIRFHNYTGSLVGNTIWISAVQLEEVIGDRATPSPFQPPSPVHQIDISRALADGKTVYFVSNTFHGATEDHKFGPDPSTSDNGLTNPEPYGDKWISLSPPYKTYLYFSNATNKTAQTVFHVPGTTPPTGGAYANTHWPFSPTGNNDSGWYEHRDTGDALAQEGLDVRLHMDSIYRVAIGEAVWTEESLTNLINSLITLREDNDGTTPIVDFGDPTSFGETREILLNPVPPPDTNLHAHWTMNSFNPATDGSVVTSELGHVEKILMDVSGKENHARAFNFENQTSFVDNDPASYIINVSGNHSLFANGYAESEPVPSDFNQHIMLAANGASGSRLGASYPVDLSDTGASGGFSKQTVAFWFKPRSGDATDRSIIGQDALSGKNGAWSLKLDGNMTTTNNDIRTIWTLNGDAADLTHTSPGSIEGWHGANDAGTYTPIRQDEWHYIAVQTDRDNNNQALWIYREGEGLLYYKANTSETIADPERSLILNGDANNIITGTRSGANGFYDEVRLYNSILTPRNIRYLYMNPTGRPRQLQPRPGLGVKKGYVSFFESPPLGGGTSAYGVYTNSVAYFHGFDVDGNPADVDPHISFNGNVKYLKRGHLKVGISSDTAAEAVQGNTGYVMYNDTAYVDGYSVGGFPLISENSNYVFAMPVGANSTQPHTWRWQDFWDSNNPVQVGWKYFTPDDNKDLVVGEMRLANNDEQSVDVKWLEIETIEAYQMARKPSVVRESYNFTITPDDFTDNFQGGTHFFANAAFWNSPEGIESTFILSLVAEKIQTGTLTAGVKVGAEAKVTIDGKNSRIVIKD